MGLKLDLRSTGGDVTAYMPARSGDSAGNGGWCASGAGRGEEMMPLYEFTCAQCGRDFEELVSSASGPVKCPDCKSDKVERKFSVFASSAFSGKSKCSSCKPKSGFS